MNNSDIKKSLQIINENTADIATSLATNIGAPIAAGAATGQLARRIGSRLIPGVGTALSWKDAWDRWKDGDRTGAVIAALAGAAFMVPGAGALAGLGLDAANIGRDIKKGEYDEFGRTIKDLVSSDESIETNEERPMTESERIAILTSLLTELKALQKIPRLLQPKPGTPATAPTPSKSGRGRSRGRGKPAAASTPRATPAAAPTPTVKTPSTTTPAVTTPSTPTPAVTTPVPTPTVQKFTTPTVKTPSTTTPAVTTPPSVAKTTGAIGAGGLAGAALTKGDDIAKNVEVPKIEVPKQSKIDPEIQTKIQADNAAAAKVMSPDEAAEIQRWAKLAGIENAEDAAKVVAAGTKAGDDVAKAAAGTKAGDDVAKAAAAGDDVAKAAAGTKAGDDVTKGLTKGQKAAIGAAGIGAAGLAGYGLSDRQKPTEPSAGSSANPPDSAEMDQSELDELDALARYFERSMDPIAIELLGQYNALRNKLGAPKEVPGVW
jgi:hypothetical protein